jgi:hypothetical protein
MRQECLDRLLILNRAHLTSLLSRYVDYYNERRPHQGLGQRPPTPMTGRPASPAPPERVRCRPVLGGLIRDYHLAARTTPQPAPLPASRTRGEAQPRAVPRPAGREARQPRHRSPEGADPTATVVGQRPTPTAAGLGSFVMWGKSGCAWVLAPYDRSD